MKFLARNLISSTLVVCALLLKGVNGSAVTVKVDSTKPWIGWVNVYQTNGAYLSGNAWNTADLPAVFIPANNPSGWPLNTHLVLKPNTTTYNPADPYWNFPDGSPNKVLEANFYVDVFTNYAGKTVTFQGFVASNSIPGLSGAPASGWEVLAFIKEFSTSYDWVGMTSQPLHANSSFSVTGGRVSPLKSP